MREGRAEMPRQKADPVGAGSRYPRGYARSIASERDNLVDSGQRDRDGVGTVNQDSRTIGRTRLYADSP